MISSRYVLRQRLNVGAVRHLRVGHDGGRVGVGQHHLIAFGLERLAGLRAGVIELRRLANDDGPGADDQDLRDVIAAWHLFLPLLHQPHEILEQVMRVVRAGRRLRVILHREQRQRAVAQAFQSIVVQVDVRLQDF